MSLVEAEKLCSYCGHPRKSHVLGTGPEDPAHCFDCGSQAALHEFRPYAEPVAPNLQGPKLERLEA